MWTKKRHDRETEKGRKREKRRRATLENLQENNQECNHSLGSSC